eukprot:6948825-Ditylum_brightwellii.AAC.1
MLTVIRAHVIQCLDGHKACATTCPAFNIFDAINRCEKILVHNTALPILLRAFCFTRILGEAFHHSDSDDRCDDRCDI